MERPALPMSTSDDAIPNLPAAEERQSRLGPEWEEEEKESAIPRTAIASQGGSGSGSGATHSVGTASIMMSAAQAGAQPVTSCPASDFPSGGVKVRPRNFNTEVCPQADAAASLTAGAGASSSWPLAGRDAANVFGLPVATSQARSLQLGNGAAMSEMDVANKLFKQQLQQLQQQYTVHVPLSMSPPWGALPLAGVNVAHDGLQRLQGAGAWLTGSLPAAYREGSRPPWLPLPLPLPAMKAAANTPPQGAFSLSPSASLAGNSLRGVVPLTWPPQSQPYALPASTAAAVTGRATSSAAAVAGSLNGPSTLLATDNSTVEAPGSGCRAVSGNHSQAMDAAMLARAVNYATTLGMPGSAPEDVQRAVGILQAMGRETASKDGGTSGSLYDAHASTRVGAEAASPASVVCSNQCRPAAVPEGARGLSLAEVIPATAMLQTGASVTPVLEPLPSCTPTAAEATQTFCTATPSVTEMPLSHQGNVSKDGRKMGDIKVNHPNPSALMDDGVSISSWQTGRARSSPQDREHSTAGLQLSLTLSTGANE